MPLVETSKYTIIFRSSLTWLQKFNIRLNVDNWVHVNYILNKTGNHLIIAIIE